MHIIKETKTEEIATKYAIQWTERSKSSKTKSEWDRVTGSLPELGGYVS
jgi:hypothetical protein